MANQKRKVLLPPSYGSQTRGNLSTVREIQNPAYVETDESQPGTKMSLPLPDYETLFPKRRHGVQGQTRWDHIIAEVNQKYRDASPELLGPEMSVDGPEEHKSSPTSSVSLESPAMRHSQAKPVSTKKVAAPAPPKQAASPLPQSPADFSQRKNNNNAQQSLVTPSQPAVPTSVRTNTSSRGLSGDGARKALQPPTTPASRSSQMDRDTAPSDDQRKAQATMNKEVPTAKPRQRVSAKEPTQEQESAVNSNLPALSTSLGSSMDKKAKENFAELDPFPNSELISTDPWAQSKQNREVDYLFTDNVLKEQTPQDQSMTPNNFDNIFSKDKPTDTFAAFNGSDFNKHSNYRKSDDDDTKAGSPVFQRKNSQRGKKILPSTTPSQQIPEFKEETNLPMVSQGFRDVPLKPHTDVKTQNLFNEGEDPFGTRHFFEASAPLQVVMEEPESVSEGKGPLRAWVSPSEVQPVSNQNSNGSGLAINSRRPHPVKPMSTIESQSPHVMKEIKVQDSTPGKLKVIDSVESGPYTQLTQEELITMVVKQQTDLTMKDAKIVELEEYIDNLLVRVIEEKPSILQSLNAAKPV